MLILDTGAVSGAGISLTRMSAAVRGGTNIHALRQNFRSRETGQPIRLAMAQPLDVRASWEQRMGWLARQAMGQIAESIGDLHEHFPAIGPLKLFLSLPSPRPGLAPDFHQRVTEQIAAMAGVAVDRAGSAMIRSGHDGAIGCFGLARAALAGDTPAAALVGAVDSWIDVNMLHWLDGQKRLKRADVPNGIVPGEGAAFFLLVNEALATLLHEQPAVICQNVTRTEEPKPWYLEEPSAAVGLTRAIQSVFAPAGPGVRADITMCDLNGEAWRAEEWSFAYLRTVKYHSEPLNLWHPADILGDTGAAAGALLVALAAHELGRVERLRRGLVWSASDVTPYRGALVLERNPANEARRVRSWD